MVRCVTDRLNLKGAQLIDTRLGRAPLEATSLEAALLKAALMKAAPIRARP
jgi:uncharacterized protein YjbI with pentapeptide repeats